MIGILENIRAILKKVRGLFRIKLIWWKDLFWNIIKERVYFAKRLESGRTLKKKKKGRGVRAKLPSLLPSPAEKQGRREWCAGSGLAGGLWATTAAGGWGKRTRRVRGFFSLSWREQRWSKAAWP